jgi:hypothetical protein
MNQIGLRYSHAGVTRGAGLSIATRLLVSGACVSVWLSQTEPAIFVKITSASVPD